MAAVQMSSWPPSSAASFASFTEFMENIVLPGHLTNPSDERLDGRLTSGNRDVAGTFWHLGRRWKVHSDTHYDTLLVAYNVLKSGIADPFVEQRTPRGNSLDLVPALRDRTRFPSRKYLYIYEL